MLKANRLQIRVLILAGFFLCSGCQPEYIGPTVDCSYINPVESAVHPKDEAFRALLNQYVRQGLPGIILLVRDEQGVWINAAGKAESRYRTECGHVSLPHQ